MDMNYKKWSETDTNLLKELYPRMTVKQLAVFFKCAEHRIIHKVQLERLKKPKVTENKRRQIIEMANQTHFPRRIIASKLELSIGSIDRVLKNAGIKRGYLQSGWKKLDLLKGFHYDGNKALKTRYQLLYAYHNSCWDCKIAFVSESDLQIHHDFTKLPIQSLVLCRKCHLKRHKKNIA
jgi:hypothetical protein